MLFDKFIFALALTGIVDAISYMVVAPSIIFYVLEVGGTKEQYGLILSAFSLASFCTKPFLGAASDNFGFRVPYFVALSMSALGGFLYLIAGQFDTSVAITLMLVARLFGGMGGASAALGFAYLAKVVPHEEQTKTNSLLSMMRILGMALGPVVNLLLSHIDATWFGFFHLDPLNSVGLVLIGANCTALAVMYLLLEEPSDDHSVSQHHAHRLKSSSSVGSSGGFVGYLELFTYAEIAVPILSILALNANFQLIETGFAPAASHALGWGPVQSSAVLGSISIVIFVCMLLVFQLSARGVKDPVLMSFGLILSMTGYGLIWALWVWEAPVWHFVAPMILGVSAFPFLAAPTRSIFTAACDGIELLDGKQGTMQAILSMFASVAGFTTPGLVAAYVLRDPEEVEESKDHRELSPWALFAPFMSFCVLMGLTYIQLKPSQYDDEDGMEDEDEEKKTVATETTGLVSSDAPAKAKRKSGVLQTTRFPAEVHIHRKSAAMVMGIPADSHHREHHGDDLDG